jgi:hypothetical protein
MVNPFIVRCRRSARTLQPDVALRAQQDLVGDRAAKRTDLLTAKVGQGAEARRISIADAQHLAELVVRQRHRHRRPPRRRVFDPAHADVGVAAADALVDRFEADVEEFWCAADPGGEQAGDLDIEPDEPVGTRRVGLDKRRAAFRIARPSQHLRRLGGGHDVERGARRKKGLNAGFGFHLRVKLRWTTVALAKVVSRTYTEDRDKRREVKSTHSR